MSKHVTVLNTITDDVLNELKEHFTVDVFSPIPALTDEAFQRTLQRTDAIIGFGFEVTEELLGLVPNVKIFSTISVGYNHLHPDLLAERNILAAHTPNVLDDTVADLIFSLVLATARRIPELDKMVKNKQWIRKMREENYGIDVHHKKIGIIGMGRIGEAIAKRAHFGFDMDVLYYNRSRKEHAEETYHARYCSLEQLLQESDFVVLMTPLTKETAGMIGAKEFALMKDTAIFINGSRGGTVVEADLIEALRDGKILAAGLDVFEEEPINPDNPLLEMDNVVTLPHIGSSTAETELAMEKLAAKNIVAALTGEKPPTLVDETVWNKLNQK